MTQRLAILHHFPYFHYSFLLETLGKGWGEG